MRVSLLFGVVALVAVPTTAAYAAPDCRTGACRAGYVCGESGGRFRCVVAPKAATATFGGDFRQGLTGNLGRGGTLTVQYDPARARTRNSHNGAPAWGVQGYAKILPGGSIVEGKVVDFKNDFGHPTNTPIVLPWIIAIPSNATRVELWFKNWSGADHPAQTWDSNYGRNYGFDVRQ